MARVLRFIVTCCLAALVACGGDDAAENEGDGQVPIPVAPAEASFTVDDKTVTEAPTEVAGGVVEVIITNNGKDKHFVILARVNEGVPQDKLQAALKKGFGAFFPLIKPAAFVAGDKTDLGPGETGTLTVELTEGQYIVTDPEAKGFKPAFFQVGAESGEQVATPEADYEITEGEYYIDMPEELPAGSHTFALMNAGEQGHELIISETKTDKEAAFALAPVPGATAWIKLDLKPGKYLVACFFPDVKDGKIGKKNHFKLGMKTTLTVE